MIRIFLGNVGSGKTACAVRELYHNPTMRNTYSNIMTKKIKNNNLINKEMLIKKEIIRYKKDGTPVTSKKLNIEFWKHVVEKNKSINVIIDEAHTIINSRRSQSDTNKVMTDFLALLRRVLGSSVHGHGSLTLISQLERRLDVVACEMATNIRFHICHYNKVCSKCGASYYENNECPDPMFQCINCGKYTLVPENHQIEVYEFKNMDLYRRWFFMNQKTYFKRYIVKDIVKYFPYYDTRQWENLISED